MKIVMARIDNRLLHGITATQWAPRSQAQRLMVIDDETAGNEMMKSSMKLARPAGMALSIIALDTAITNIKNGKYGNETIYIITKKIQTFEKLMNETGVVIKDINIGATSQVSAEAMKSRKVLSKFASFDDEEMNTAQALIKQGVHLYVQYLVADTLVDFSSFLR